MEQTFFELGVIDCILLVTIFFLICFVVYIIFKDIRATKVKIYTGLNKSKYLPGNDKINPMHYKKGGIEAIDYVKAKTTKEGFEGYLVGNVFKYITRYRDKNGIEDLKKARWNLDKLIDFLERG